MEPNVQYQPGYLPPDLPDLNSDFWQLRSDIPFDQHDVVIHGTAYPQPRLVKWYGPCDYTYSGLTLPKTKMHDLVEELRRRVSKTAGVEFNSCMCNLYRSGQDCVGWHSDDENIFGKDPIVASLSVGGTRKFSLRRKAHPDFKVSYELSDGDLLIMGEGTQKDWQHQIHRTKKFVEARICLTFRRVVFPKTAWERITGVDSFPAQL